MIKGSKISDETKIKRNANAIKNNIDYLELYGYKYKTIPDEFNQYEKVILICPHNHEWKSSISNFRHGKRCKHCKDEKYLDDIKKILNEKDYELISNKWLGSNKKLKIKCNKGHIVEMSPDSIKSGSICKICSDKIKRKKLKLSYEDVKKYIESFNYFLISNEYENNNSHLEIKCDKGHNYKSTYANFKNGKRCPYCKSSKGENIISEILDNMNISYIRQYRFDNCKDKYTLPFDFYLNQLNILIEFDGIQHFRETGSFGNNDYYHEIKKHDDIKNKFSKDNNIKLIRINYKEIENIKDILEKELLDEKTSTTM